MKSEDYKDLTKEELQVLMSRYRQELYNLGSRLNQLSVSGQCKDKRLTEEEVNGIKERLKELGYI